MYLHCWQLSTASTSASPFLQISMTSSEPKAQTSTKQPLILGVRMNLTCFQQILLFSLMITNSGLGEFRELLHIQLKLHDLVDLDEIPSPAFSSNWTGTTIPISPHRAATASLHLPLHLPCHLHYKPLPFMCQGLYTIQDMGVLSLFTEKMM